MGKLFLDASRIAALNEGFAAAFGGAPQRYFSAPGRTELSGNHTDHQRGRVLAAAVDLDTQAAVRENGTNLIRIQSQGYPLCQVDVTSLMPRQEELNSTPALIRGVAARFHQLGCQVKGFDAYVESTVLPGSGLSSSAAFEVLIGTIINHLFFDAKASAPQVAMIGQYAENVYFGKPSGLLDQMASSSGGLVAIDFKHADAKVTPLSYDFTQKGYALVVVNTGGSHADLTDCYASIPAEMRQVAACFGETDLRRIRPEQFFQELGNLRNKVSDRALMRAIHYYGENVRVDRQVEALKADDMEGFKEQIIASGRSSYMYLQNVYAKEDQQQLSLALAIAEHLLNGKGAWRVHGGGFAGTTLNFVPNDMLPKFIEKMETVFGVRSCQVLDIRPEGAAYLEL